MKTAGIATLFATAGMMAPGLAWAQSGPDFDRYYWPHMMGWNGYGMVFGPIFMVLVLAATIALAVLIVRWLGNGQGGGSATGAAGQSALDILRERYARGEIDKEEFEERRRVLEK